jgi:protein-disulfide isomerase
MKTRIMLFAALLGLLVLASVAPGGMAQSKSDFDVIKKQIDALLEGQKAMQKDIQAIKDIASGKKPPLENVFISLDGDPSVGEEKAPITIVEFADYQCPFCGRHATQTFPQLLDGEIKTGKIRYVYKDFPLDSIHPMAFKAAEAAHCAGEQGKYWEMHERLFKNQQALASQELQGHAVALGLNGDLFKQCLDSGKFTANVKRDIEEGLKYGVKGTPSFFVGTLDPTNSKRMRAISMFSGAQPLSAFQKAFDGVLSAPEERGKAN